MPGAVRNADRIWASTPRCTSHLGVYAAKTAPTGLGNRDGIQKVFEVVKVSAEYPVRLGNRTYRTWGELELPN